MNHIAFELIRYDHYEILHVSEQNNEIWLEKYENKTSKVIRVTTSGFDWTNELKRDITHVFNKINSMGNLLVGKIIDIRNIYVSEHPPVDSWEVLKKPISLKSSKQMHMKVYYVNESDYENEMKRLSDDIFHVSMPETDQDLETLESNLHNYQMYINNSLINKRKRAEEIFSFGKPVFTYLLIAFNVIFFMIIEMLGSSMDVPHLIQFGAKFNPLIMDHEWWRIISSMFIHIGFFHLFMNMLALFYIGNAVERIYGPMKFLFIYLLSGISGGLASFAFTSSVSAGASGAIFGLFGSLLFFALHERKVFLQTIGRGIIFIILFNVIFGFIVPQIDNAAHIGGLVAGFISSAIVHLPKRKDIVKQLLAFVAYILLISGFIFAGFSSKTNIIEYNSYQLDLLTESGHFEEVLQLANESIDLTEDELLLFKLKFQRSIAYIELGQYDLAIEDLKSTIEYDDEFHPSYYNLALIYDRIDNSEEAKKYIRRANELHPDDTKYTALYIKIIGNDPDRE